MADETEEDELKPLNVTTDVKDLGKWMRSVHVTVAADDVNEQYRSVLGSIMGAVQLPGFRPGKVPRDVVEKKFGTEIKKQVLGNLLERALPAALESAKVDAIGEPDLDPSKIDIEKGKPFTFEFKTEVVPQFEVPVYKGLKAEQQEIDLLPEEIETALKNLRGRFATLEEAPAGQAAAEGDQVHGVLRTLIDGQEISKDEDEILVVTKGHVYGLYAHVTADYLVGAKVGDKRTLEETLTAEYPKEEYRGKRATFEFEIKKIVSEKLPAIDDEFAKKMECANVDALNEKVHKALLEQVGDQIKNATRESIAAQLLDTANFELPEKAAAMAASQRLTQSAQYLSQMGISAEQSQGMIPHLIENSRTQGVRELKRMFVLQAIADKENITVEDEELDDMVMEMAHEQNMKGPDLFQKLVDSGQIKHLEQSLRLKKTMDFIVDNAEIAVVPRKPFKDPESDDHGHSHEHSHEGHEHGEHAAHELEHDAHAEHAHGDCGHEHGEHGHGEHGHEHGPA